MTNKEKSALQKEIVDSLDNKPHGRLLLAPRCGKTCCVINLIKRDKPKSILWVTPSAKLADEDIPLEFDKWKAKKFKKLLITSTWTSLHKITGHYDLIVLDEDQNVTLNNCINLLNKKLTGNIISMTGTPSKHEEKIDIYRRLKLKTLYKISINQAVDIGLLSNYTIKVLQVPMSSEKNVKAGNKFKSFMTSEIAQYNWMSSSLADAMERNDPKIKFKVLSRMRAIKNSPSKLKAAKQLISKLEGRKLIFSANIKQAEELCKYTYHSKTDNKDLKAFQNGDIDSISMVNAGGTGFTYKNVDHLILVQSDSDKQGLSSQKISRVLLSQKNYKATIWIICLMGTQDEKWVKSTLQNFDESKIECIKFKNLELW